MQHDRTDLDRHRDAVMKPCPTNRHGIRLRKRFAKIRDNLFVFVTEREVAYTNNASESALRPSVVFRKVTNGFRSVWGADPFRRRPLRHRHRTTPIPHPVSGHPQHLGPTLRCHRRIDFIRVSNYLYLNLGFLFYFQGSRATWTPACSPIAK